VISPVFTIIAGANGAGKSTLTSGNPEIFSLTPLLDPDRLTRPLASSGASRIAAGREVLLLAKKCLDRRESFTIETTLSGRNYLGTESVNINLSRIRQRVLGGGHDVPENDVRRRYKRSLDHLPVAVQRAAHTLLFDNSTQPAYQLIGVISPSVVQWFKPLPGWAVAVKAAVSSE